MILEKLLWIDHELAGPTVRGPLALEILRPPKKLGVYPRHYPGLETNQIAEG
jgi:hypothetical protein